MKAAADKLLADLQDAKGDIEKAKAALDAGNKEAAKAMRGELKEDRETLKADREALRELAWQSMIEAAAGLEEAMREEGFRALRLSVTVENGGARAFWERVGFAPVERLRAGDTLHEKLL